METKTFNQQLVTQKQSGLGIAGMVIGIISILLSCIIVGGFLGIIGLILSICGVAAKNRKIGTAIAGTVLNSLAIFIMIFMLVFSISDEKGTVKNVSNSTIKNIEQEQTKQESNISQDTSTNTKYATLDKFNQIETGMTYEEVVEIMGSEGTVMSETEVIDIKTTMYYWYAKNGIANMNIMIQNDKVVSKAQIGLN